MKVKKGSEVELEDTGNPKEKLLSSLSFLLSEDSNVDPITFHRQQWVAPLWGWAKDPFTGVALENTFTLQFIATEKLQLCSNGNNFMAEGSPQHEELY